MPKATRNVPRTLGRYEVLGQLGVGGMAEILLARLEGPSAFERAVVIKRILPHLAGDPAFVDMFLDEARLVAGIRHPNVVQVQELQKDDGELLLVMEYVEGESLGGVLRRLALRGEQLDLALAAHVIAGAAAGLHAAHELRDASGALRHVVHRDVSPQNVMVSYAGEVKVLDFGVAQAVDRSARARTHTGQVKGKHEYMSPEQCRSEALDRRSDVFALGILLYELSVGKRLFRRANGLLTFQAICELPIPSPRDAIPDYPECLEAICRRALARSPDDRYETAQEMRRDLVAAARSLGQGGAIADIEDEAIGRRMQELFPDRIEEKRRLWRQVREGSHPHVPRGETDTTIELPNAVPLSARRALTPLTWGGAAATRDERAIVDAAPPRTTSRARAVAIAALAGALALAIATRDRPAPMAEGRGERADIHAAISASPTATGAPVPGTPASPAAEGHVSFRVDTTPEGARLAIAGAPRGATPAVIDVPRAGEPILLSIALDGFVPVVERLTPDADQHVVVHLQAIAKGAAAPPAPSAAARRRAAPPLARPASSSTPFQRFD